MRLFIAIELPDDVRRELARLQEALRGDVRLGVQKAAWVRPQNLHLTLKFIGETSDDDAAGLCAALREVQLDEPIVLRTAGLLCLPPRGPVRIIAVELAGDLDPLRRLHKQIESICAEIGYAPEDRAYRPHVTLARCRSPLPPSRRRPLIDRAAETMRPQSFTADHFVLMQSVLGSEAAQYTPLGRFPDETV